MSSNDVCMSQTGKTEAQNCWLGYVMDHAAPAPMLLVQPTCRNVGKRLSKQRLGKYD